MKGIASMNPGIHLITSTQLNTKDKMKLQYSVMHIMHLQKKKHIWADEEMLNGHS